MTTRRFLLGSLTAVALSSASAGACGGNTVMFGTGGAAESTSGSSHAASSSSHAGSGGGATTSSTTGTGTGAGGAGGCAGAADCDDGFSCTIDVCNAGVCAHTVGPESGPTACPAGSFCLLEKGCVPGTVCATTAQCLTALGADACKANIACDPATSICTYTTLDKDSDGHPPIVCGGDDCNDADPTIYPGAPEICDGKDNNCNGAVDESATCPGLASCTAGACVCPPQDLCGTDCADLTSDSAHCGSCANACPSGATCVASVCQCSATATVCGGQCVDLTSDPAHCGSCTTACLVGEACQASACTGCPAVDLYILQDVSASMTTALVSGTRLQISVSGINAFTAEATPTVSLGLGYFPLGGNSCIEPGYTTPTVAIAPLPGNTSAISTSLAAAVASAANTSPQAPALQGALSYVHAYELAHAGHVGAVVLITDGLPDSCTTPNVATDVAGVAAMFLAGSPSVKTFVVSLGADVQASLWDTIAAAGGTGAAVHVTNPTNQYSDVQNALDGIQAVFGHCGPSTACAHDECTAGATLDESCSACAAAVCLQDAFCCVQAWDGICVGEVPTFCAPKTCP